MSEEKEVKLEIVDGKIEMVATTTKVQEIREVVDLDKFNKMIENYNLHIANAQKEIVRVQAMMNDGIASNNKLIDNWQKEITEVEKQIVAYKALEKELPQLEEDINKEG